MVAELEAVIQCLLLSAEARPVLLAHKLAPAAAVLPLLPRGDQPEVGAACAISLEPRASHEGRPGRRAASHRPAPPADESSL